MAINFPNSPSAGDPHSEAGIDWVYDGEKWVAQSEATFWARTNSTLSPSTAGDNISTTGDLTAGCTTTGTSGSSGAAKVVGYQQGIWTPYYSLSDGSGAISDYDNQDGTFTRIGNQITAYFYCVTRSAAGGSWSYQNGASNATATIIDGLPYTQSAGNPVGSGLISWGTQLGRTANNTPAVTDITVWVEGGDTKLRFNKRFAQGDGTYGYANVEMADFILNSGSGFQGVVTYTTSDTTWAPSNGATIS